MPSEVLEKENVKEERLFEKITRPLLFNLHRRSPKSRIKVSNRMSGIGSKETECNKEGGQRFSWSRNGLALRHSGTDLEREGPRKKTTSGSSTP